MQRDRYLFSVRQPLLMLSYGVMTLVTMLEKAGIPEKLGFSLDWMDYAILMVMIIQAVLELNFTRKKFMQILAISAVVVMSVAVTGDMNFVKILLFVIAMKETRLNDVIRLDFVIRLAVLLLAIVLSLAGYLPLKLGDRFMFGMGHPNSTGLVIMTLTLEAMYLKRRRRVITPGEILCILAIILMIAALNISRTTIVCLALALLFYIVEKYKPDLLLGKYMMLVPTVIACVSLLAIVFFDTRNPLFVALNQLLSGRLSYGYLYYKTLGFSVLGKNIDSLRQGTPIDNAYIRMAVEHGVLILILFVFAYTCLIRKCIRERATGIMIPTLVFLIFGISESFVYSIGFNFTLLFLSKVLWEKRLQQKNTL